MTEEQLISQARIAAKRFCRNHPTLRWEEILSLAFVAVKEISATKYGGQVYHKLIRCRIIDQLRAEKQKPMLPLTHDPRTPAPKKQTEKLVDYWHVCEAAIEKWNPLHKRIVRLVIEEGMAQKEVAKAVGVNAYVVHDTMSNLRQKLRRGVRNGG